MANTEKKEILKDILYNTCSLKIEAHPDSTRCINLALLQPLAESEAFAACRNPGSRFLRDGNGAIVRPSNRETLDIGPLSLAWRQIIASELPFNEMVFDVTLPTGTSMNLPPDIQELSWEDMVPLHGGAFIITQDVMNLVINLATVMWMRTKGNVCFKVVSNDHGTHQPNQRWSLLRTQLTALEKHKALN